MTRVVKVTYIPFLDKIGLLMWDVPEGAMVNRGIINIRILQESAEIYL